MDAERLKGIATCVEQVLNKTTGHLVAVAFIGVDGDLAPFSVTGNPTLTAATLRSIAEALEAGRYVDTEVATPKR